jgi:hypothetical protein
MAAVLWLLLNFVYAPSCGRFACGYEPAWLPQAAADSGDGCPDSIQEAINDADWAAARVKSIADKKVTTGLMYDEDGMQHQFTSGGDEDSQAALEYLREAGFVGRGTPMSVEHVETKIAARMRATGVTTAVVVINNKKGPCGGTMGCTNAVQEILLDGSTLFVWSPPQISAGTVLPLPGNAK